MINTDATLEEIEAMSDELLTDYWNALLDVLEIVERVADSRGLAFEEWMETEH